MFHNENVSNVDSSHHKYQQSKVTNISFFVIRFETDFLRVYTYRFEKMKQSVGQWNVNTH